MNWIGVFEITRLLCTIRDDHFLSQLEFKNQVVGDHSEMTAELSHYQLQAGGDPRYISGVVFMNLRYNDALIEGDTGETPDLNGRFSLTRLSSSYQGQWAYAFERPGYQVVRGNFNCGYQVESKRYLHPPIRRGSRLRSRL